MITIQKYKDEDYESLVALLIDGFEGKFLHKEKMSKDEIYLFLTMIWKLEEDDKTYEHYVAKDGDVLIGDLLLQIDKHPVDMNVPYFKLIKMFGFFRTIFFLLKMLVMKSLTTEEYYIEHILVDANYRGLGIGKMLLDKASDIAKTNNQSSITLLVAKDNIAKNLYDREGYQDTQYKHSALLKYFTGLGDWILMKKEIN